MPKNSPLDTTFRVQTPENVEITYALAGMTARLQAYLIDILLSNLFTFLLLQLILTYVYYVDWKLLNWGYSLFLAAQFFISWGYWIVAEGWFHGKTLGKKMLGLRVISVDGTPITMTHSIIRNLLRVADSQPGFLYQVGFWCMAGTKTFQRLGDLVAGTIVVQEIPEIRVRTLLNQAPEVKKLVEMFPADFQLPDSLRKTLTNYMVRRKDLTPARCQVLAHPLAERLAEMYHLPTDVEPDLLLSAAYERFVLYDWESVDLLTENDALREFFAAEDEKKRAEAAILAQEEAERAKTLAPMMRMVPPAPPDPDDEAEMESAAIGTLAFLRKKMAVWKSLDALCAGMVSFFRYPSRTQRLELAANYRSSESDLAMSETYRLEPRTVTSLQNLLGRAYQILYRAPARGLGYWTRKFFLETPRILFSDPYVWCCLLLFYGFFFGTMMLAASRENFAASIVGEFTLWQAEWSFSKPVGERSEENPEYTGVMTGFYISHNAKIGIQCMALGVLGGFTGILVMLYNAVSLGAIFGHMTTVEQWGNFSNFVTAHGPCELTAAALGTAVGVRIGFALIAPHGLRRTEAVRLAAATALPAMMMFLLLFFIAAFIEGFISPSRLPYSVKSAVAIVSGSLLVFYFFVLGGIGFFVRGERVNSR